MAGGSSRAFAVVNSEHSCRLPVNIGTGVTGKFGALYGQLGTVKRFTFKFKWGVRTSVQHLLTFFRTIRIDDRLMEHCHVLMEPIIQCVSRDTPACVVVVCQVFSSLFLKGRGPQGTSLFRPRHSVLLTKQHLMCLFFTRKAVLQASLSNSAACPLRSTQPNPLLTPLTHQLYSDSFLFSFLFFFYCSLTTPWQLATAKLGRKREAQEAR